MPNTLGVYNPIFYANEALILLQKGLGLASRVHVGFDAERRTFDKGDTISIRRPSTFTAEDAPGTAANLNTETVNITLDKWRTVKFALTDKEHAYTGDRIIQDHIAPAAYALADDIDQKLAAFVIGVPHNHIEGSAGTAATLAGVLGTRKKLFDQKVPLRDEANMFFMLSGKAEADLLALSGFSQWQGAGATGVATQMSAQLGRRFGMEFFANQNTTTVAYADISDFAGATTANIAKGATSFPVGSLGTTETIKKGTVIKMSSGTDSGSEYAVTADVTMAGGAGTLVVTPAARNASTSGDTFTIDSGQDNVTNHLNLGFHRHWAALAMARLTDFGQYANSLGAQVASVQDPVTGLAVRSRIYYVGGSSQIEVALDVLYGVKELNADLACRYEFKV